ncbi:lipopolysaccharide biosynthesis protein [Haliea sp. E17]|uniref:lipopolysaccharide biosynthesis protein n=1 Tax=Haliea sp. E17 TaxID=3401576 RepID=UPI003AB0A0FF
MLKHNLTANFIGRGWSILMGIAFVPIYIKYLGIESYGLIGLYAVLQAWLALLDLGISPTMIREMGRLKGGGIAGSYIRDLLRSFEAIVLLIAVLISTAIFCVSDWLAIDWVTTVELEQDVVAQSFAIMGCITSLQFINAFYRGCLTGMQRQVLLNTVDIVSSTLRGVGSVCVLVFLSPTLHAFFIWQALVVLANLLVMSRLTYANLPQAERAGRFSLEALHSVRKYAAGMFGITFLSLLLTQMDKLILSKMLPLSEYGYYTLAFIVASGLRSFVSPIANAWYPRLVELYQAENSEGFVRAYHEGAQLVSVLVGSFGLVMVICARPILELWTQDDVLTERSYLLVCLLVIGNVLNGLMTIPYYAQLAYGWTGYALRVNLVSVLVLVPALVLVVPHFGASGAASIWILLNTGYLLVSVQYMYARMLKAERWTWYRDDILRPLLPGALAALVLYFWFPAGDSMWWEIAYIVTAIVVVTTASLSGATRIRARVLAAIRSGG